MGNSGENLLKINCRASAEQVQPAPIYRRYIYTFIVNSVQKQKQLDQVHLAWTIAIALSMSSCPPYPGVGEVALHYVALQCIVSFTNPLAAGSGLVERTPKKVRFLL